MAKWGEGDPRWIVEERPDATNVNNWHWTEKNAQGWSKDYMKDLLVGTSLKTSLGTCMITEIEKMDGDASANNRKAKIIVFYEWDLKIKWLGNVGGKDVKGSIVVPNLSDENTMDDLDIMFKVEGKDTESQKVRDALRKECTDVVREKLGQYIEALRQEFTKGMILPKKEPTVNSNMAKLSLDAAVDTKANGDVKSTANSASKAGCKLEVCDITTSSIMKCNAQDVFNALMRPEMFTAFTNGSGQIDPKVGGTFHMFGGNVHGKILEINAPSKIVQQWRMKHWPDGHFSTVTFTITEKNDSSEVTVHQRAVPKKEEEATREGWDKFYWDAMKRTFGFGSYIL